LRLALALSLIGQSIEVFSRTFLLESQSNKLPTAMNNPSNHPTLLAPAGDWDCAKAAVENGADAIYFGLDKFNARMRAENFSEADLPKLIAFLHQRGVKGYLTLNTLIFPAELAAADRYLRTALHAGVDAVIVQDLGICRLIRHISPNWPIHASTQMTITSAAGVQFAQDLGCNLVVLARECSIEEIAKIHSTIGPAGIPLEIFVHGALCVAYSGQCLTSEALGGRSANRGECAQACRLPYRLIADGQEIDLGDRQYLLSPQDLSGLELLPQIIQAGVSCLKIEGRLKTPEYVASVTKIYREAIDRLIDSQPRRTKEANSTTSNPIEERYRLEMAFSRGLSTGWLGGIDNQALVPAEFSNKRGAYLGQVTKIGRREVNIKLASSVSVKAGDGLVFGGAGQQIGGRVYTVTALTPGNLTLTFDWENFDLGQLRVGDRLWKTSDPELSKEIRQTYASEQPQITQSLDIKVSGAIDQPLSIMAQDPQGRSMQVSSNINLALAQRQPLTPAKLHEQLGRLGGTPFHLGNLEIDLPDDVMLPVSELNRLRRSAVEQLLELRAQPQGWTINEQARLSDLLPAPTLPGIEPVQLHVLVRRLDQLWAAIDSGIAQIYCEFSNPADYRSAVTTAAELFAVPPRITKGNEKWTLQQLETCKPEGYLVRNYDQFVHFQGQRCIGDFSLNIANALTAEYLQQFGLERLTASYDLNISQLLDLVGSAPAIPWEVTIHQHIPMFHMEHCVFCAFLSNGHDYKDCGRPCDSRQVELRDSRWDGKAERVGTAHVLQADVGCRNTLYNGIAQTGAEYWQPLVGVGVRHLRLEFLQEDGPRVSETIDYYQRLLAGQLTGAQLWQKLQLRNQLGVTRGTLV
jgi:U32 family peptidase